MIVVESSGFTTPNLEGDVKLEKYIGAVHIDIPFSLRKHEEIRSKSK
jgi:hypothetical protein